MTQDAKIHEIALAYICKSVGKPTDTTFTKFGWLHPSLVERLPLEDGELVLVSAFFANESWYAFTTRRITSRFHGELQSLDPSHGIAADFGNFKGYAPGWADPEKEAGRPGVVPRETATVRACDSQPVVRFEFETWEASFVTIYASRYWRIKHPVLDKLMTTAEREKARNSKGQQCTIPTIVSSDQATKHEA